MDDDLHLTDDLHLHDDFHHKTVSYKILNSVNSYILIEVQENEYRRSMPIYFSRVIKYKKLGYLLEKNPRAMLDYLLSTCCFNRIDNYDKCNLCNKKFSEKYPFFLNCNIFLSYRNYDKLAKRYNLGVHEEIYRDQRTSLSNPEKQEIITMALSPERIMKILEVAKDTYLNINKYI
jgi:hypothetical protein